MTVSITANQFAQSIEKLPLSAGDMSRIYCAILEFILIKFPMRCKEESEREATKGQLKERNIGDDTSTFPQQGTQITTHI